LRVHAKQAKLNVYEDVVLIPDTVKFLFIVCAIAGAAFGGVWGLAHFPPEPSEIVRPLPVDKLRQAAP
jgi:hypothetical protein